MPIAIYGGTINDSTPAVPRARMPRRRRILVVDDSQDSADSLGTILELMGAEVRVVYDGTAALELLDTFQPSAVLLDIGMPAMDGYEVARRIRQASAGDKVTLIALTGWGQEAARRLSQEVGFDHHWVKPVDPTTLMTLFVPESV